MPLGLEDITQTTQLIFREEQERHERELIGVC